MGGPPAARGRGAPNTISGTDAASADTGVLARRAGPDHPLRPGLRGDRDRQALNESAAQPDYGPSLPQLLGPWLRGLRPAWRVALAALAVLVVGGIAAAVIVHSAEVKTYSQSESDATARGLPPIAFRFDHSAKLAISRPPGAYVQAERRAGGLMAARMTITPFRFRPQAGLPSGYLPIVATRLERDSARRYRNLRLDFEGRARVNQVEGYQYAFRAQIPRPGGAPRQLFGRVVILPEPYDLEDPGKPYPAGRGPDRGVLITMLSTTADEPDQPIRVGDEGSLQRPFRSFRFG